MPSRRDFLAMSVMPALLPALTPEELLAAPAAADLTQYVNPFAGTGAHGHTYPGATMPWGMVQLSPDTYNEGWDWCSGYHVSDGSLMGFSHTHLSGTGCADLLDVLVMPGTGAVKLVAGDRKNPTEGYRSRFKHEEEKAEPGYYSVPLSDYGILAELTATERCGLHCYTFPASDAAHFMIDLSHAQLNKPGEATRVINAQLKVTGNDTISGGRRTALWAPGRHIYFALKFSRPFDKAELFSEDQPAPGTAVEGRHLKCVAHLKTKAGEKVLVKVGLSPVSAEAALKNLEKEIPAFDFAAVRKAAKAAWQRELGRVKITSSNEKQKRIFYTGMYRTMLAPTLYDDADGQYRGMDGKVHQAAAGQHNYSTFSTWDTYRALHPLYTLVHSERVPALMNCLIRMGAESPAGMPVWPLHGVETGCMTGTHSLSVLGEAAAKGFTGVDWKQALELAKKRSNVDPYRGMVQYRKLGYIPCDEEEESATKTLEYSYNDWAVAQIAKAAGSPEDYKYFARRSANYRNLFDKSTGFMRPRLASGEWAQNFNPKSTRTTKKWRDFTESNSWQGTWAAQHDAKGYFSLFGSKQAFLEKLDALWVQGSDLGEDAPVDVTGLIGQYAHGNEPSQHIAYFYCYAGQPWKTQARVREILETMHDDTPEGVCGNEDCGQMSAWMVISSLGLYAPDPASGNYVLGAPWFEKAEAQVGPGKTLVVEAPGNSKENKYVQSVTFNGKPLERVWLSHAEVSQGGRLVFRMGPKPNESWGAAETAAPPSLVDVLAKL